MNKKFYFFITTHIELELTHLKVKKDSLKKDIH